MKKLHHSYWPSPRDWKKAWSHIISERDFGFFDGGCLILAEALKMILSGSRIGTILVQGRVDHYVVRLSNGSWADADGTTSCSRELATRYGRRELSREQQNHIVVVDKKIEHRGVPRSMKLSRELALLLAPGHAKA